MCALKNMNEHMYASKDASMSHETQPVSNYLNWFVYVQIGC